MNDLVFIELIKSLIKNAPDVSYDLRSRLGYAIDDDFAAIWWSVEDFEHRATCIEVDYPETAPLFDREKFKEALECMCIDAGEDCDYGTTWGTVDDYLNNMCRLEGVSCG